MPVDPPGDQVSLPSPLRFALLFEMGLAALGLGVGWVFGLSPIERLTWSGSAFLVGLVAALPLLVLFVLFEHSSAAPLSEIRSLLDRFLLPMLRGVGPVGLLLLAAAAGFGEEILFRGLLQELLARWFGVTAGIVLASLVFGLAHAVTKAYFLIATLIGLFFGWLYLWSGNLSAPIVTHAAYDFFALVYMLERRHGDAGASDGGASPGAQDVSETRTE